MSTLVPKVELKPQPMSEEISVRDRLRTIGYSLWPQVLIIALGMKVARMRYAGEVLKRTAP